MTLFVALTVIVIAGIAAMSWWWVTTHLSHVEATAVYDLEEAIDFVAARVPGEVDERLDRDQVAHLLGLHLAFLRRAGMATYGGVDEIAMDAAVGGDTVVAHEDEAVDYVMSRLATEADKTQVVDVVVVIDLSNRYLASIGAFGPSVDLSPGEPT